MSKESPWESTRDRKTQGVSGADRRRRKQLVWVIVILSGAICILLGGLVSGYQAWQDESAARADAEQQRDQLELAFISHNATSPATNFNTSRLASPARISVPAVSEGGGGTIITGQVTPIQQQSIFIDISELTTGQTLQQAIQTARAVSGHAVPEPAGNGFVLELDVPSRWDSLNGNSIGLAVALGFLATNETVQYRSDTTATGRIQARGTVRAVGDVPAKIAAAADQGYDRILVPPGQGTEKYDITVTEVGSVAAAAEYAFSRQNRTSD